MGDNFDLMGAGVRIPANYHCTYGSDWGFPLEYPGRVFMLGLFLRMLGKYTLHRLLIHHQVKTPKAERIFFLFHDVHHAQPQDKTRLLMPFPVSIPLALVF